MPRNEPDSYAQHGAAVLDAYSSGELAVHREYPEVAAQLIEYVISDLMHFGDTMGINTRELLDTAAQTYMRERVEAAAFPPGTPVHWVGQAAEDRMRASRPVHGVVTELITLPGQPTGYMVRGIGEIGAEPYRLQDLAEADRFAGVHAQGRFIDNPLEAADALAVASARVFLRENSDVPAMWSDVDNSTKLLIALSEWTGLDTSEVAFLMKPGTIRAVEELTCTISWAVGPMDLAAQDFPTGPLNSPADTSTVTDPPAKGASARHVRSA